MKKFVSGIMAGVILALCISVFAQNAEIIIEKLPLKYIFNGVEKAPTQGEEGFIYNDRTYVPIRFVSESLGKEVLWNEENYTIDISDKEKNLTVDRGELYETSKFKINLKELKCYPKLIEDLGYSESECFLYVCGIYKDYIIIKVSINIEGNGCIESKVYKCSLKTDEFEYITNTETVIGGINQTVENNCYIHTVFSNENRCYYIQIIDLDSLMVVGELFDYCDAYVWEGEGSIIYTTCYDGKYELRTMDICDGETRSIKSLPDDSVLKLLYDGSYMYIICFNPDMEQIYYYEKF